MTKKISNYQLGRKYGFSQGRLSVPPEGQLQWFPQNEWRAEFANAGLLGCSFIELLAEREKNMSNPLWSVSGRIEIVDLCKKNGLEPYSICLDYIIDNNLFNDRDDNTFQNVVECIEVANDLDCKLVIIPLLEKSSANLGNFETISQIIRHVGQLAETYGILVCLETLLPAEELNQLINWVALPNVKVVFDTGNRVLETPNIRKEIHKLKKNIGHVHIKDKNQYGKNVILGSGLVDFCEVFRALNEIEYLDALNFETNRGNSPLNTAKYNITLCDFFTEESLISVAKPC